jgi:hypothetical protein
VTRKDIQEAVEAAQKPLIDRVDKIARQRTLLLVVALLSLIIAAVAVLYGINRENAFQDQLTTNQIVVCASAKSAALAPRKQSIAGESRGHYLNRLEAQREQLLAVGGLDCPSLEGFATFPYLRAHAIAEIEAILGRLAPAKLREAIARETSLRAPPAKAAPKSVAANPLPSTSTPADAGGNEGSVEPAGGGASPGSTSPHHPSTSPPHPHPSPPKHHPPPSHPGGGKHPTEHPSEGTSPPAESSPPSSAPESSPVATAPPTTTTEGGGSSGGEQQPEQPQPAAKPGIIGNPGGVVGELLCTTNKLGLPVCAE